MFALINSRSSCYLDSLLVCLFVPAACRTFFEDLFFTTGTPAAEPGGARDDDGDGDGDGDGGTATNLYVSEESDTTSDALSDLRHELREHAVKLHLTASGRNMDGWNATRLRELLTRHATAGDHLIQDFSAARPQSAVDCFKSLLELFGVRDVISQFQTSTTMMKRRPETVAAQHSLTNMVFLWVSSPVRFRWDSSNADLLPACDVGEGVAFRKHASAFLLENCEGDRRRVTPPEWTSVFLCQLTLQDLEVDSVDVTRELRPHVEVIDAEAYTGDVAFKMIATKILRSPVLLFEVSRNVTLYSGGRVTQQKIMTTVNFGTFDPTQRRWHVNVHGGGTYRLVAVICHLGSNLMNGHYVAYVEVARPRGAWYFYDDTTPHGKLLPADPARFACDDESAAAIAAAGRWFPAPSKYGELFFYVQVSAVDHHT
jgi:hypothetical protein